MIVCVCHRVSDRDIARLASEGCNSFDMLQDELLVATACGSCRECAVDTFEAHRSCAARSHRPNAVRVIQIGMAAA